MLAQSKSSAMVPLSRRGLELFEWPPHVFDKTLEQNNN